MNDLESGGRSGPGPEPPHPGLFDGVNNYVLLVYAAACFMMYYSLAGLFYLKGMLVASTIVPGIAAIVLPLSLISRRSPLGFAGEFRLRRPAVVPSVLTIAISAAAILPAAMLTGIIERRYPSNDDYISFLIAIKPKGPLSFALVALGIVVVAAIAEELLFRGFVQRIFQRNMRAPLAIVFAGLLFGCCHFDAPALPGATLLGIFFGYLFWKTGSLIYPLAGHALFNLVQLINLSMSTVEEITSPVVTMPPTLWTAVSLAVFIAGLWLFARRASPPDDRLDIRA